MQFRESRRLALGLASHVRTYSTRGSMGALSPWQCGCRVGADGPARDLEVKRFTTREALSCPRATPATVADLGAMADGDRRSVGGRDDGIAPCVHSDCPDLVHRLDGHLHGVRNHAPGRDGDVEQFLLWQGRVVELGFRARPGSALLVVQGSLPLAEWSYRDTAVVGDCGSACHDRLRWISLGAQAAEEECLRSLPLSARGRGHLSGVRPHRLGARLKLGSGPRPKDWTPASPTAFVRKRVHQCPTVCFRLLSLPTAPHVGWNLVRYRCDWLCPAPSFRSPTSGNRRCALPHRCGGVTAQSVARAGQPEPIEGDHGVVSAGSLGACPVGWHAPELDPQVVPLQQIRPVHTVPEVLRCPPALTPARRASGRGYACWPYSFMPVRSRARTTAPQACHDAAWLRRTARAMRLSPSTHPAGCPGQHRR